MAEAKPDPVLETVLAALVEAGFAAEVWDENWRLFGLSEQYQVMIAAGRDALDFGIGLHFLEDRMQEVRRGWPAGPTTESMVEWVRRWGGPMAAASPGGIDGFREFVGPAHADLIDELEADPLPALLTGHTEIRFGTSTIINDVMMIPLRREDGSFAGAVVVVKPAVGAAVLAMLALGDARLFQRMLGLIQPAQKPGAILFGDLESSTALARRLPSAAYFALIRRLSFRADQLVVDAGGFVGKHVGDGVTAFFLSEDHGSDSAAARACIEVARGIQEATPEIAERSGLEPSEVTVRFGLHWGAGLYVGRLLTSGRLEMTALGDEVNEGARIEASAAGGLRLASKPLVERLDASDASALGLDPMRLSYMPLSDVETAPEKAQRDAANISVCPV